MYSNHNHNHLREAGPEMYQFLDYMESALRSADYDAIIFAAFVWSQRGDRIIAGEESFEDQNMRDIVFGGPKEDHVQG